MSEGAAAAAGTCAALAAAAGEPLAATAPRTDHWLLVEVHGQWEPDAIETAGLGEVARAHARAWLAAVPNAKLILIRRPERRDAGGIHVYLADGRPGHESLRGTVLARHDELAALDLVGASAGGAGGAAWGAPVAGPLLLVCHHGRRDACCARLGKPLYEALIAAAREGGGPGAEPVWQCSHIGGHRFAGNVVVLPEGSYLGRVEPAEAPGVLALARSGRIPLANARGRASLAPAAQAADLTHRAAHDLDEVAAVTVAAVEEGLDGAPTVVRLRAGGTEHAYCVRPEPLPTPSVASCGDTGVTINRLVATPA